MFNKLLSNLSFNPSLINQVSFYSKRLRQEASIRRLGFMFVGLTMFLQLFIVLSPAQPTLARAGNDILPGGFSSKDQAVQACQTNTDGFATILAHFAISCTNLSVNSDVVTIRSTDDGNQLYSMGREPQGSVNQGTGKVTNETPVTIGGITYYMRLLSSWDNGPYSTYTAISVGNKFGVRYYVLFTCGNIVQTGRPVVSKPPVTPVPPPPAPKPPTPKPPTPPPADVCPLVPGVQTEKSQCLPCPQSKDDNDVASCLVPSKKAKNTTQSIADANNTTAKPNDVIVYKLYLYNSGKVAGKTTVSDNMADVLEYANITGLHGGTLTNGIVSWPAEQIDPHATVTHQITVQVMAVIPQTPPACPPSSVVSSCPANGSFDHKMVNTYGNTITILVPQTVTTVVQQASTTLTNTGPGTSLIIGFSLFTVVGYFFARSRLLARELDILKSEYTSSQGI